MITYQVERWPDFVKDAEKLFPLHWEELALDKDVIKQDMDAERYLQLDKLGMLHITTARLESALVGYTVNFLLTHMHYKSSGLMAVADMYFLLPAFRKGNCGVRLFQVMEAGLREKGVVRAATSCKLHQDHEELFVKLGWRFTDKTFTKIL